MTKMISYCGLDCAICPAYLATVADDDKARDEVAKMWSKMFNADIKAEHINCLGCHSEAEPIFSHCRVCEFRLCAKAKGMENCAMCPDYACENLLSFFEMAKEAKDNLEEIRKNM
jgi:predicted nucleic acid binding AN1-type Zn finger protein